MKIKIKKLHQGAIMPTYAHETDAAFDLYAYKETTIKPGERASVPTGLAMAIPDGHAGLIWDKSGLSHKFGLRTLGGVIDAGYRGEIMVGMVNLGQKSHTFEVGEKVAQMLIQKVEHAEFVEVDTLEETARGEDAFGSTGK